MGLLVIARAAVKFAETEMAVVHLDAESCGCFLYYSPELCIAWIGGVEQISKRSCQWPHIFKQFERFLNRARHEEKAGDRSV